MNPETAFTAATITAMAGWLVLIAGIILQRQFLVRRLAGQVFPLVLAAAYAFIAPGYFTTTSGGFDSLVNLQVMFSEPWLVLGGWIHWLAADLFIASWISREVMRQEWGRFWLALILPFAFLVGPLGLIAYHALAGGKSVLAGRRAGMQQD